MAGEYGRLRLAYAVAKYTVERVTIGDSSCTLCVLAMDRIHFVHVDKPEAKKVVVLTPRGRR